jgi:adenylate cyclase
VDGPPPTWDDGPPTQGAGPPTRDDMEREILGETPSLTSAALMDASGTSVAEASRLWRALGFADAGEEAPAFTQADAEAMALVHHLVEGGHLDFDTAVRLTRAVGHTMARLADWQVSTLSRHVEKVERAGEGLGSRLATGLEYVRAIEPPFERLMVYAWRRHLAAAVGRVEALGASEEDLHTSQVTVGFADIVSFTALTNRLDHDRIGDLVEIFESRCADVVAACHGRVIKSIGDAVLFVNEDPIRAYDTAEGIITVVGRDPRMPDVRIGLSTGMVVMRLGDVFGRPVNLASRLTAVARRNRIIVDQATADVLPADQFETRSLPERPVRGFGVVQPVAVRRH